MIGLGWAAGKIAKEIAKAAGASEEDAKFIGRATSITTSIIMLDVSGLIDLSVIGPQ